MLFYFQEVCYFIFLQGRDVAASPLLNVGWPPIALVNVPTHLETYSNDVEITAKFTANLCSQMLVTPTDMLGEVGENHQRLNVPTSDSRLLRKLPFEAYLELVSCPPPTGGYNNQLTDCQV